MTAKYYAEFELRESQRPGDLSSPENLTVRGWAVPGIADNKTTCDYDLEITNWRDEIVASLTISKDGTITIHSGKVA